MSTRSFIVVRYLIRSLVFVLQFASINAAYSSDLEVLDRVYAALEVESNDDVSVTPAEMVEWLSAGLEKARAQLAPAQVAEIHYRRGIAQILLGERKRAKEDFEKAVELDSQNVRAQMRLAILMDLEGERDTSDKLIAESLERHATPHPALVAKATVLLNRGQLEPSIDVATQATQINGILPRPYWLRSVARFRVAQSLRTSTKWDSPAKRKALLEGALKDINSYVDRERIWGDEVPLETTAYRHRGEILSELGKTREALSDFVLAQKFGGPDIGTDLSAQYYLLDLYATKQRYYATMALAKKAIAIHPPESYPFHMLGWSLQRLKCYDESLDPLLKAYEMNRDDPTIASGLAETYFVLGKDDLAAEICRKLVRPNEECRHARTILILLTCGSTNAAVRNGTEAVRMACRERSSSHHGFDRFLLGAAQSECGAFQAAVNSAEGFAIFGGGEERLYFEEWIRRFRAGKPFRLGSEDERIKLLPWNRFPNGADPSTTMGSQPRRN